ncbi:MAG: hypothetical protein GY765_19685 [bacterium]|nr:hypothetical protein [bacterium]
MAFMKTGQKSIATAIIFFFLFMLQIQATPWDTHSNNSVTRAVIEKEVPAHKKKKKRSIWPFIIGGVLVAGTAFLLLKKSKGKEKSGDNNCAITTEGWGDTRGSGQGQFNRPGNICIDASGYVYVADSGNLRIQKFSQNGKFIRQFNGENTEFTPLGMTTDNQYLYVCELSTKSIMLFSHKGKYRESWVLPTDTLTCVTEPMPYDITTDNLGNLYVTDRANSRILKLDGSGELLNAWGSGPSCRIISLDSPSGIGVKNGEVFVSDIGKKQVVIYDTEGTYLRQWGKEGMEYPTGIDFYGTDRVMVNYKSVPDVGHLTWGGIFLFDTNGTQLGEISNAQGFASVSGIAVNEAKGRIYATDYELHKVLVIDIPND